MNSLSPTLPVAAETPAHVMVDIEAMGTDPFSPVIAIGAVRFAMGSNGGLHADDLFYQVITLESCIALGLRPSASTIVWWTKQSEEARAVLEDPAAVTLPEALDRFTDWLGSRPDQVWGNSARFDCGLVEAAYKACSKVVPWEFWRERCYRTVKNLPGAKDVPLVRLGTHHNALDDAMSQALHLRAIWQKLGL